MIDIIQLIECDQELSLHFLKSFVSSLVWIFMSFEHEHLFMVLWGKKSLHGTKNHPQN